MGVGGSESVAYNLISRLILLSDPLFFFGVCSWWTCAVFGCVTSLVWTLRTVVLLCVPSLVFTLHNVVLLCIPSLCWTFRNGVLIIFQYWGCRSRQILVLLSSPSLCGQFWHTLVLMIFPSLNVRSLQALVFESFPWLIFPESGASSLHRDRKSVV